MSRTIARRVVVRGHVQGVFFRDSARRRALGRNVSGWIANRDDGAVEAWLEGEPDAVQSLIEFCRQGPRSAEVRSVDVSDEQPRGSEGFEVR